jgi:ERCC4-type nuclease
VAYASDLDLVGKNSRQRKVRPLTQDTREPDEVTAIQLRGLGYALEQRAMIIGDYGWPLREQSWLREMGFVTFTLERKKLSDLRDVVRLRKQLTRARHVMSLEIEEQRTFFTVMVEYLFDTDRKRRWSEEAILNAELSIQLGGVRVTRCEGNDVAGRIHSLYGWSQKRTHQLAGGD